MNLLELPNAPPHDTPGHVAGSADADLQAARRLCFNGQVPAALGLARRGLSQCRPGQPASRLRLLCTLAMCLSELGRHVEATSAAEQALAIAQALREPVLREHAVTQLALCLARRGQLRRALALQPAVPSPGGDANTLQILSGQVGLSIMACEEARARQDSVAAAAALARACRHAQATVDLSLRQGDTDQMLRALNNHAKCLSLAGHWQHAGQLLHEVRHRAEQRGLHLLAMRAEFNLSLLLIDTGQKAAAETHLRMLLNMLDRHTHDPLRQSCLKTLWRLAP